MGNFGKKSVGVEKNTPAGIEKNSTFQENEFSNTRNVIEAKKQIALVSPIQLDNKVSNTIDLTSDIDSSGSSTSTIRESIPPSSGKASSFQKTSPFKSNVLKNNQEQTNTSTVKETASSPFKIDHVQLDVVKKKFSFKSPFNSNKSRTESSVTEKNLFGIGIKIGEKRTISNGTTVFQSNPWSVNADSPPHDCFTGCFEPKSSSAIPGTPIENKNKDEENHHGNIGGRPIGSQVIDGNNIMDETGYNMDTDEEEMFGDFSDDDFESSPPVVSKTSFSLSNVSQQSKEQENKKHQLSLEKMIKEITLKMDEHMKQWYLKHAFCTFPMAKDFQRKSLSLEKTELKKKLDKLIKNGDLVKSTVKISQSKSSVNSLTNKPASSSWISDGFLSSSSPNCPIDTQKKGTLDFSKTRNDDEVKSRPNTFTRYDFPEMSDPKKYINHPLYNEVHNALKTQFGLRKFRQNQLDAIMSTLDKKDCFILMPTGGGKSLCYQLTSIVTDGVSVVVSPLRSLIADQVQKLKSLKIAASHLSSDISPTDEQQIYLDLNRMKPSIKLLYVTPEKLSASNKLVSTLQNLYKRNLLARFVIDEAHCISQWGHDFRPDYKKLNQLRSKFPNISIMALTATATPRVQKDILNQLCMKVPAIYQQSFNRSNLQYFVLPKSKKTLMDIVDKIKSEFKNASGILYCLSRRDCDSTARHLSSSGIQAAAYHAGLTDKQRSHVHESWLKNRFKVVCATIAFGMGIDKPDVRFVFHYTLPKSVEGYFQESGRAGRDGRKSVCILFYQYSDMHKIKRMIESDKDANAETRKVHIDNLFRVVQYCENKIDCRRAQQIHYFGERDFDSTQCKENPDTVCDNCMVNEQSQQIDITDYAVAIVESVRDICHQGSLNPQDALKRPHQRITLNQFVDIFKGSQNAKTKTYEKCPLYNKGKGFQRTDAERLFRHLVLTRVLSEKLFIGNHENVISYVMLGPKARDVLMKKSKMHLSIHNKNKVTAPKKRKSVILEEPAEVSKLKEECLEELMELRNQISTHNNLPNPETIVGINALRGLAEAMPSSVADMLSCIGITEHWYQMWGEDFILVTKRFSARKEKVDIPPPLEPANNVDVPSPYFGSNDIDCYDYESERMQSAGNTYGKRGAKKRFTKYAKKSKYKKKSPKKQTKNTKGAGWPPAWTPNTTSTSSWKATSNNKLPLMGPPKAKRPKL